jgi:hypothetical protein
MFPSLRLIVVNGSIDPDAAKRKLLKPHSDMQHNPDGQLSASSGLHPHCPY